MAQAEHTAADPTHGGGGFICTALSDVAVWQAAFEQRQIPVLAATAEVLEDLRAIEDAVDAHLLAETVSPDPLMTLKLLRHVAALRQGRGHTDAETTTEALVMLGITPFFRDFGPQPSVEQRLADQGAALAGLRRVLRRSHRAARFALGFAVHRRDHDAALIHEAALLHDFAEMLLWVHAPALALAMVAWQQAHPGSRSTQAQRQVLNIELGELQQALMKAWRLPSLLVQISDHRASHIDQVRNVQLAIRVARHSSRGWDNPALPDDVGEVARLLNLSPVHAEHLLHDLDH
jgi:HD-like signal output (HDOD) protein